MRTTSKHQLSGVEDVHGFVKRVCFKTGPPGTVGLESEWFVHAVDDPARHIDIAAVQQAMSRAQLPHGSLITYEPGGQLELSALPAPDLSAACRFLAADLAETRAVLAEDGLSLLGQGVDPVRIPSMQVQGPRYSAMRRFFAGQDDGAEAGEAMMTSTAAIQICLDAGRDTADVARRWQLANALLPVLLATFANSPFRSGRPTGWRSSRFAVWSAIDAGRTRMPRGPDPVEAWARYALAARVMVIRSEMGPWVADPGITFEQWVSGETPYPRPTEDDLAYHLTTLFPPVRPRGWFEIRYLDQLPDGLWQVAAAVTTALVEDARAADIAFEAIEPVATLTPVAMRSAVTDPRLRRAAERCLEAATDALPRLGAVDLVEGVETFHDTYTSRGRCPADDLLDDPSRSAGLLVACDPLDSHGTKNERHALWP